ncbi:hypothetical protein FRC09_006491 [Ceratobasidium sp. 395]|nr:hypothetical protein FRC09_006491 [Ceratobasidium sp. 395]
MGHQALSSKPARSPRLHRPQPGESKADSSSFFPTWFCSSSTNPRPHPDPVPAPVPAPAPNQVPNPAPNPAPLAAVTPITEFEPKPQPEPEPTAVISTIPAIFIEFAALIILAVPIPSIPSIPSANGGLPAQPERRWLGNLPIQSELLAKEESVCFGVNGEQERITLIF